MAPPSKKRKLPATSGPAPKRNKNSSSNLVTAKGSSKKPSGKQAAVRVVDAASLAWESVGEDFGGLEVIKGVDVVKHGSNVQFVVTKSANEAEASDEQAKSEANQSEDGEESFEGFSDGAAVNQEARPRNGANAHGGEAGEQPAENVGDTAKQPKTKQDKQQKKQQRNQRKEEAPEANTNADEKIPSKSETRGHGQKANKNENAFGALDEEEVGDGDVDVDVKAWMTLKVSSPMLDAIAKLGFATPTAIQERAVPEIIGGEDVIGKAQTGSGKTLAFGIPIVEKWLEWKDGKDDVVDEVEGAKKHPLAVVLSPTRELAKQLGDHLKALCEGLPEAPFVCVVTGGLSIHKQQRQLEKADIVIATPGRLWEVMDGDLALQDSFTNIKFLVVDEADRLFKVGQFKEAENIIGALDRRDPEADQEDPDEELPPRQTLVFSATFDKDLQTKLAGRNKSSAAGSGSGTDLDKMAYLMKCLKFRREPKFIDVNPVSQMATGLREGLIECGAMEKDLFLYTVLVLNPNRRTLVFTNSISAVRRLTPLLQNLQLAVHPLHSQMAQKARLRSLERFAAVRSSILVATDVAARGLDIKEVDQVIHYHVPRSADTYIHRSGRTARGDRNGVSVMLCSPEEVIPTRRLVSKVHEKRSQRGQSRQDGRKHVIQMLPLDRRIASRLKPRVDLSKRIADVILAKEKGHSDEKWLRNAAEELGVEMDDDELDEVASGNGTYGGRGGGRKRKEKEARSLTKAEMGALKAQLREELGRRVNLGVSERYITGGRVDVGALLKERENLTAGGIFLGGENLGLGL
ncbi:hypothetical protein DCS_02252 [Drechmeria coniospora]|uniref:ATP-dependent RNA helicase n=1 Tax=Drechmeria coniospora TaxID=98403 RepID=A0A151GVL0_DRECN|nr:hypothetical protein DCS_02252 [Drechmeria coniospora]KYK61111.1 hypothetical protein DCS_02252 [Drechmeria coniospora]